MKRTILCCILLLSNYASAIQYSLSIGAVFRDEGPYLKEWIEFHRLVGVEHFYLYNHLSTDEWKTVLTPYIQQGVVEILKAKKKDDTTPFPQLQPEVYNRILKKSAGETTWIAFLDIDEFLFPVEEDSLLPILEEFSPFAGICANWQMYGTSFVERIPKDALLIETLLLKAEKDFAENIHVKSIVKPHLAKRTLSPHHFDFLPSYFQVDENKREFFGPFSPAITINKLRINHYWSRDEKFFYERKIPRREKWGEASDGCERRLAALNTEPDDAILRFVPALKERMATTP